MAKSGYLYRRSSGIYVVRICVPIRLQKTRRQTRTPYQY